MKRVTDYARLTPLQARLVLAVILAAAIAGVAVTLSPMASSNIRPGIKGGNDVALYRAEIERIRHGQGYYDAAAAELAPRGYPTRSVFNWRTPLPMWLLGKLPADAFGKVLLGGLALMALLMAVAALVREETVGEENAAAGRGVLSGRPISCALLLIGPLMLPVLDQLFVVPVLWAGVFIALSVCAFGLKRPYWGVAFGLSAAFLRELALLYCLLGVGIALWRRRRGESAAWLIGLAAWLGFYAVHWWTVSGLIAPDAIAHHHGWVRLGGAGFVISTAQMNAYLLPLPQWVTALYLVAALVGFAGWGTAWGTRVGLSVCLFLATFAVVGQSFNQYWGSLIAPLLCFGVVRFPASLWDLWRTATRRIS